MVTGLSGVDRIIRGPPNCLIMSMITEKIGQNELLLQINHNYRTKFVMF